MSFARLFRRNESPTPYDTLTWSEIAYLAFPPVCFAFLISLRLWIMSPFQIVARYLPRDDLLYARLARSISADHWLGYFHDLTLAKPPGFALWLAIERKLYLPPLITEQVIYFIGAGLLYRALVKAGFSPIFTMIGIAILIFAPEAFSHEQMRLSRVAIYDALGLLIVAICITCFQLRSDAALIALTVLNSLLIGLYGLIREEFIWFAPVYAVIVLGFWLNQRRLGVPTLLMRVVLIIVLPLSAAYGADKMVRLTNMKHYGTAIVYDQRDGNFPRAMGAIARIAPEHWRQYVPLSKQARAYAYDVSPTFARIRPLLDGGDVKQRAVWESCLAVKICTDMSTGWIFWAVRNAVMRMDYYDNARRAEAFYGRVASDINKACDEGRIPCGPPHNSLLPVFRPQMMWWWVNSFQGGVNTLLNPDFLSAEALRRKDWWLSKDRKRGISEFARLFPHAPIYQGTFSSQEDMTRLMLVLPLKMIWPWTVILSLGIAVWYGLQTWRAAKTQTVLESKRLFLISVLAIYLAAVASRLGVLAVVDAGGFPAFGQYMVPTFGMAAAFCAVAVAAALDTLAGRRALRQPDGDVRRNV